MRAFALMLAFFVVFVANSHAVEKTLRTKTAKAPLVVAVMDPLSKDLACKCIAGFAQREYRTLSAFLKESLDRPVEIVFASSLQSAMLKSPTRKIDVVIGKDSVVKAQLDRAKLTGKRIASLSDKDGKTTFAGIVVVASDDTAQKVADLGKHRILFGTAACNEKSAAAFELLQKDGIAIPKKIGTYETGTQAVLEILGNESKIPVAAFISDYELVLMEGCKTVEKDAVRIVGTTGEVPFISVFSLKSLDGEPLEKFQAALAEFNKDPKRLESLESKTGFEPLDAAKETESSSSDKKKA